MPPFGHKIEAIVSSHTRTTDATITDFLDGVDEGQVPRYTGRSPRKPPPAPMGR